MSPKFVVRSGVATIAATALFAVACTSDRPSPSAPAIAGATPRVATTLAAINADRHIIQVRPGASVDAIASRVATMGGRVERSHAGMGLVITHGLSAAAAASLRSSSDVLHITSDRTVRWIPPLATHLGVKQSVVATSRVPHVDQSGAEFFPFQWNLNVIHANNAWLVTREGRNTMVCDLDTGVDPTHIDLAGKINLGVSTSFVATEPDILDRNTHGTYVSALISSNGIGMASVAPEAELCQVKVLDETGRGSFGDVISGVIYATDVGADVINMSLGSVLSPRDSGVVQLAEMFQQAVNYALRHGVTIAAAAGNNADNLARVDSIALPAELFGVISVGATAPTNQMNFDQIASYSDFGFPGTTLFAPGGDFQPQNGGVVQDLILSACSSFATQLLPAIDCTGHNTYIFDAGTSAASPHVAGEAAVLKSDAHRRHHSRLEIRTPACIINGTDRILTRGRFPDPLYGFGRIDVIGGRDCRHLATERL
ncbi:MAG: S8 family serine peptidase [Gemmatimonadales bacterium]